MSNHENSALRRGLSVIGKLLAGTRKGPSGERVRQLKKFQKSIGVRFTDLSLLEQALTHRSYSHVTAQTRNDSNERMEFLGDSVLGLSVSQFLYLRFRERSEGTLSKMKSLLVSRKVLSAVSRDLGVGEYLLLSGEESEMGGRDRTSILADSYEGIIGAIYLDQGYRAANQFVSRTLLARITEILKDEEHTNYKSLLQEHVQSKRLSHPVYRVRREEGPEHEKEFAVDVVVRGDVWGSGRGKSKKEAEQLAARAALEGRQAQGARSGAPEGAPPDGRRRGREGPRGRGRGEPVQKPVARERGGHGIASSREKIRAQRALDEEKRARTERESGSRRRGRRPRGESEPARRPLGESPPAAAAPEGSRSTVSRRPRRPRRRAPEEAAEGAVHAPEGNGSGGSPDREQAPAARQDRLENESRRQGGGPEPQPGRPREEAPETASAPRTVVEEAGAPRVPDPERLEEQNGRHDESEESPAGASAKRASKELHSFSRRKRRTMRGLRRR
jgi:ribonuclease-3